MGKLGEVGLERGPVTDKGGRGAVLNHCEGLGEEGLPPSIGQGLREGT